MVVPPRMETGNEDIIPPPRRPKHYPEQIKKIITILYGYYI